MTLVRKRIVLPLIPSDIFQVIRPTQNKDAVLDLTYQQLLSALSEVFSGGGSLILLQTNGVDNGSQNLLNLAAGPGTTLTDDGLGTITITSSGGASFITSIADTSSINLDVTSGVLTASLVDIVASGTFGDATHVPQITIDTKGRVTSVSSVPITAGAGTVTSVSASVPSPASPALSVTVTNPTTTPAIAITANGTTSQYIRGDGSLATLPTSSGGIPHATATGTNTYAATISGVTSYADGDAYLIRFTNGNTTGATLNINSLGAVTLYRNNDGALIGGDIVSGGEMLCVYNSTSAVFQCIGTAPNTLLSYVTNDDSVTITKGMAVYAFGGTGDRMTVKRALNTSDATSAQTVGLVLSTSIAANQKGLIMMQGLLDGLSILPTSTFSDGDAIYLGTTAGSITNVKQYAPNHLVYLGVVTTASNGSAGRMYVRVQNGYELDELHNVQARTPALKDTLWYDNTVSPAQWKTASIPTILGYTPVPYTGATGSVTLGSFNLTAAKLFTTTAAAMSTPATLFGVIDGTELKTRTPSQVLSDIGAAPSTGIPIVINQENYPSTSNSYANLYVASVGKLYICNNASNTVLIYDVSTGVLLSTIPVTGAYRPLLASNWSSGSAVDEVWVSSTSTANLVRINCSANTTPGSIALAVGTTSGYDIVNYSSTKAFVTNSLGSGAMSVINPTTLTLAATVTLNMSAFPCGMAYNSNGSSSQNGFIVVACLGGVLIFNPATNSVSTTVNNPSSIISTGREIRYNATKDKYYIASSAGNNFTELSIASATTFTASVIVRNIAFATSVQIDEAAGYIFVSSVDSSGAAILVNVFNYTTLALIIAFRTNAGINPSTSESSISIDTSTKKLYVVGRRTTSNTASAVKYY